MRIGAHYIADNRCEFTLWAPFLNDLALKIVAPKNVTIPMQKLTNGYWKVLASVVSPQTRYFYQLNNSLTRPDPASSYQPQGVHGPSQVVNQQSFHWQDDNWKGIPLREMIIYELHVGTFTPEGTFSGVLKRLEELKKLGINAIELMPVAQFPGERNWGYDGVYPFAVQNSYGGPDELKRFIDASHRSGIAVILDVVYNHLGPEGNYFAEFGPYFTDKYRTPWGRAINFDGADNLGVRNFFIKNVLYWLKEYHIDGLRLDAIHDIYDMSAKHILAELAETVQEFSRLGKKKYCLIVESDLNDVRIIKSRNKGGYGFDAQWCDDFHHSLHTLLTKERNGCYADFGKTENLAKALQESFVYSGEYSNFRKRHHGSSAKDMPTDQFIVFSQNHDQIGNRMRGERLTKLISFEALKLAAAAVVLSPYIPLLFMGEEYAEEAPFLYFVSHGDDDLIAAVRRGRHEEFSAFNWPGEISDPQSPQTFLDSKLNWDKRNDDNNRILLELYQKLIVIRKSFPAFASFDREAMGVWSLEEEKLIFYRRWYNRNEIFCTMNFNNKDVSFCVELCAGKWKKAIDSSDQQWRGDGSLLAETIQDKQQLKIRATSFAVYEKEVLR